MKLQNMAAALAAALLMITFFSQEVLANQVIGYLDGTDGQSVWGWAWNPEQPDENVEVHIGDCGRIQRRS